MIRLEARGIIGYGVSPDIDEPQLSQILYDLPPGSRIACVDLVTNRNVLYLLAQAEWHGHEVLTFITEHAPESRHEQIVANKLRLCLGEAARIYSRRASQSSTGLVGIGEFHPAKISVVFFHCDADGLLAFLRGAGVAYDQQVNDANSIDGERGLVLSPVGVLLMEGWSSLVLPHGVWPHHHDEAWNEIAQHVKWQIEGNRSNRVADFAAKVSVASEKAKRYGREAAALTKRIPGRIGLCDMRGFVYDKLVVNRSTWLRRVEKTHGPVLKCSVTPAPFGDVVHIQLPRCWYDELDLRGLMPPGIRGHVSFRARVPAKYWTEFWRKCLESRRLQGLKIA
ncbi:MAG: hypothetical protein V1895_01125 [Parcubacteria group bacterium]